MAGSAEIVVRVTELEPVKELLADMERFIRAANDFDNAVAEFGLHDPAAIRDSYQVVHDRLAELRRKYKAFGALHV